MIYGSKHFVLVHNFPDIALRTRGQTGLCPEQKPGSHTAPPHLSKERALHPRGLSTGLLGAEIGKRTR